MMVILVNLVALVNLVNLVKLKMLVNLAILVVLVNLGLGFRFRDSLSMALKKIK